MTETVSRANAKAASIVNVLRERESCAAIADKFAAADRIVGTMEMLWRLRNA